MYRAYRAGDAEAVLATMSHDVRVSFLGRVDVSGIDAARAFFAQNAGLLHDLDFRIRRIVVDGSNAAVVWDETATTVHGEDYQNHGVDVLEVRAGRIVRVSVNNDVLVHRRHFGHQRLAGS